MIPSPEASGVCFLSAVEMAALIRRGQLSAREAVAAHLDQIERVNPKMNAIVTLTAEQALENARKADEMQARGSLARTAARPTGRAQGSDRNRRHPDDLRFSPVSGLRARARRDPGRADRESGRDRHRQNQHARIRRGFADVQHDLRLDQKSLRSGQDLRRIERRSRGQPRLRNGRARLGNRYGRIAAKSRGILRSGGASPGAGTGSGGGRLVQAERVRSDGPHGRRCRAAVERDGGSRSALSDFDLGAWIAIRCTARPRFQGRSRGMVQGPRRNSVRRAHSFAQSTPSGKFSRISAASSRKPNPISRARTKRSALCAPGITPAVSESSRGPIATR